MSTPGMMGNQYWAQLINTNPIFTSRKKVLWKKCRGKQIESERENQIKQCFIVNKMFVFSVNATRRDSSQERFEPVWLDFVLICRHWMRQSIKVPAQSCNHVKGERNMGCDNDLPHLLRQCQGPQSAFGLLKEC